MEIIIVLFLRLLVKKKCNNLIKNAIIMREKGTL